MFDSDSEDGVSGLQNYQQAKAIGEGTYGVVFKAKDTRNDCIYALKKIKLNQDEEGVPSTCIREISILRSLNHANIVTLHDVILRQGKDIFLVFEYLDWDLCKVLKKFNGEPLPDKIVKSFLRQLLTALNYCHTRRVIHRDLKPANILVQRNGTVKLADFGLARAVSIPSRCYTHEVVTLWYRPPELLLGCQFYSSALDIWSLGCIFAEIAKGSPLFEGGSEIQQLFKIFEKMGTPNPEVWPGVEKLRDYNPQFPKFQKQDLQEIMTNLDDYGLDLLEKMLIYFPQRRITARTSLSHPYVTEYKEQQPSLEDYWN